MAIKLTSSDARAAGYEKKSANKMLNKKGGTTIEHTTPGYICYLGPCDGGTREVWYFSEAGCDDGPYYESDPQCQ